MVEILNSYKEKFLINDQEIGGDNPVFIIAEIGINHNGNLSTAIELIKSAKESGASAAKLQTYITDKRVAKDNPVYEILKKCELSKKDHKELFDYAKEIKFTLFSTPFDDESVDLLQEYKCPAYKIASFDSVNTKLISKVATTGKPLIMSTGMTNEEELKKALVTIVQKKLPNEDANLAIMHCISSYPLQEEDANLATIRYLKSFFNGPVGFSDHSLGDTLIQYSVAAGSNIIEKHFTLTRDQEGPDHKLSAEPEMLKKIVEQAKKIKKILGEKHLGIKDCEGSAKVFRRPS